MRVSAALGTPLIDLLTRTDVPITLVAPVEPSAIPAARKQTGVVRRRVDREGICQALQEVLNDSKIPPSMAAVARQLEYDQSYLPRLFPELCKEISTRYKAYKAKNSETRKQKNGQEIKDSMLELHSRGKSLSQEQVSKSLGRPGCFREQYNRDIWRATRNELDNVTVLPCT
jgi:hypothetical protein